MTAWRLTGVLLAAVLLRCGRVSLDTPDHVGGEHVGDGARPLAPGIEGLADDRPAGFRTRGRGLRHLVPPSADGHGCYRLVSGSMPAKLVPAHGAGPMRPVANRLAWV